MHAYEEFPDQKTIIPFVTIKPDGNDLKVSWGMNIRYKESGDRLSCYIPGLDIYFTANNQEERKAKSFTLSKFFFDNFFLHEGKNGMKRLALELHKRGYKAKDDATTMQNYLRNNVIPAKFKILDQPVPKDFNNSKTQAFESSMAVAI